MSCKKGGFISIQRNYLRDLAQYLMTEVLKGTEIEPKVTLLSGKNLYGNPHEATINISTCDVLGLGQQTFFDVRVFVHNTCCYNNKSLQCHVKNE